MAKDYYKILGISKKADEKEIKSAYRKLARKHHPDVNPNNPAAEAKFKEISEAYAVLSDSEKRRQYDRFGTADFQPGDFNFGGEGFKVDFGGGPGGGVGFGDLFENLFSGGFGMPREPVRPPQDIEQTVRVTLEEIDSGSNRTLQFSVEDSCAKCRGRGLVDMQNGRSVACPKCAGSGSSTATRKVKVKIPAGMQAGKKLRVPGQGIKGGNGKSGDLYVVIEETPHSQFRRQGDNLEVDVDVPYYRAALGGKLRVPTLRTSGTITIPEGTQTGQRFRLRERGLARMSGGRGDLFAKVRLVVPKPMTDAERKHLEAIAKEKEA